MGRGNDEGNETGRMEGRHFVPREARNEYLQPTTTVSLRSTLIAIAVFVAIIVGIFLIFT